jgi:hypothetical protein
MIKKVGNQWCLFTHDGKRKLGCHDTKEEAIKQEQAVNIQKHKHMSFRAAVGGELRTAEFHGQQHLVVPVVALVEGVIQASTADTPELVLASEFGHTPDAWNGRPVVLDHPDGGKTSANSPEVLDRVGLGTTFHARMDGKRLLLEAWLDLNASAEGASTMLQRLQAGELVEVSVGVFVDSKPVQGVFNGTPYQGVWENVVPDHVAFLSEGAKGACSIEMGCGAPRTAAAGGAMTTLKEKISALLEKFRGAEGPSDNDLRRALHDALFAVEPGFLGIEAVFPEDALVVYAVAPTGELQFFRRAFTSQADGTVTLAKKAEEVKMTTKFEAAAAEGCGCGGQGAVSAASEGGGQTMEVSKEKKERVAKVIERLAKRSKLFRAEDAALLEQWSDDRIKLLEDQATESEAAEAAAAAAKAKEEEDKKGAAPASAPESPQALREKLLQACPDIKALVDREADREKERRAEIVSAMKGKGDVYSEAELTAMPLSQLEKVARLAGVGQPVVDFSGLGVPRPTTRTEEIPPPPDVGERIRAARSAQKKTA